MSLVEIVLPQDGVEAYVLAYDQTGKEVPAPYKIVINPFFFRADSVANIFYLSVLAAGAESVESPVLADDSEEQDVTVQKAILQLPGSTGKLRVADRSAKVVPKFAKPFLAGEEEEDDESGDPEDGGDEEFEEEKQ